MYEINGSLTQRQGIILRRLRSLISSSLSLRVTQQGDPRSQTY
jgi:hypothetical protein